MTITTPIHLSRLRIESIRGLRDVEIRFGAPEPERGQWTVLLGENGTGKSTILRALALVLAGPELGGVLFHSSRDVAPYLRDGSKLGRISLWTADPLLGPRLEVRSKGWEESIAYEPFPIGAPGPLLFGYGCRRGAALGVRESSFTDLDSVATLFDENAGLIAVETWLKGRLLAKLQSKRREDREFFDALIETLRRLLPGVEKVDIRREGVWLRGPAVGRSRLAAKSDGYVTTLAWVLDLIARWAERASARGEALDGGFNEQMTGLVLIDEIDLHLHPKWQVRVVSELRQIFPRLSFVATTHNPLTLLGAREGEVQVLARSMETAEIEVRQVDIPKGTRADQVLTGEWFGLPSTLDAGTLDLLDQHRLLLQKGVAADDPKRRDLEEKLRQRLHGFADTSVERTALEVAAQLMTEDYRDLTPQDRKAIRSKIARQLRREVK